MIEIGSDIALNEAELQFTFIRSPGPGGQNVNKVATAVVLRFNVKNSSSLSEEAKLCLLSNLANRLTSQGDLIIKATRFRTQETNKQDAISRLSEILLRGSKVQKKRRKTKPSYSSTQKRLSTKKLHSKTKSLRGSKPDRD